MGGARSIARMTARRVEIAQRGDDEAAAHRSGDDGRLVEHCRKVQQIGRGLGLETRAAMGDERDRGRVSIGQRPRADGSRNGARTRCPGDQTFSGSDAVRFFRSAGTGRPWPKPCRFGSVSARVSAAAGAAGSGSRCATGG